MLRLEGKGYEQVASLVQHEKSSSNGSGDCLLAQTHPALWPLPDLAPGRQKTPKELQESLWGTVGGDFHWRLLFLCPYFRLLTCSLCSKMTPPSCTVMGPCLDDLFLHPFCRMQIPALCPPVFSRLEQDSKTQPNVRKTFLCHLLCCPADRYLVHYD